MLFRSTLEDARVLIEAEGLVLGDVNEAYAADAAPYTVVAQRVFFGVSGTIFL